MWKGQGRNDISDAYTGGAYEEWQGGLSPNGRQWKNSLTQETRDLSGSDYWHQRKAIEPKRLEDVPTFINGRPNIAGFGDEALQARQQASAPTLHTYPRAVLPGEEELDYLDRRELAAWSLYKRGDFTKQDWLEEKTNIDKRRREAWQKYEKLFH